MNNLELTDVNKYRLDEINKIKEYFDNEIKERNDIIKKLNKYLVSLDYLDRIFITLSASFGALSSALNGCKISHEEFSNIITEKNMCENIKENIRDTKEEKSTTL